MFTFFFLILGKLLNLFWWWQQSLLDWSSGLTLPGVRLSKFGQYI